MKLNYKPWIVAGLFAIGALNVGCKPKTPAEKVQDKVEDATHDMGQGVERAGERIKDSAN